MTYQPPQDPWQSRVPPPPPFEPPTAAYARVPPRPTAQFAQQDRRSWWRRLPGRAQIALAATGLLVLCCCGGVAIGATTDPPPGTERPGAVATQEQPKTPGADASTAGAADITAPAGPTPTEATPAEPTPTVEASPVVEIRTVTQTQKIPYQTRTVKDSSIPEGTRKMRTRGVAGIRTLTYEVTVTDGVQTDRKLVRSAVTRAPVTQVVAVGTKKTQRCDPNYTGACVPVASDVDCAGGSGNGPAYVEGPVWVVGSDIYDLDRDGDGVGCDE
ncbi:G5 domain-containing protein [Micromonospora sp. NPDC047730]|uniref:G5 domain-containing protein n=1 Tax=Micromonospora sp. NPDC047730 TaxID=3364253 RepID=UPI00371A54E6